MSTQKIIAIAGATGAQGGGLVRAILADPSKEFRARAITRDKNSEKAQALAKLGAEVVEANVDDLDSITNAMKGAYGAFCVTFYWEHFSPEKEQQQASNLARAAKGAGLEHVIWSTLEDTRKWVPLSDTRMPTLMEKYKVPHFDSKGEANKVFTELGVPTTFLNTSFYWENFIFFGMGPQRGPDGKLAIAFPMDNSKLPGIAAADIGKCALGIFKKGKELIGKTINIAGDRLSGAEIAAAMSKATGQDISFFSPSPEAYRGFGFPGAEDLGNMFQFKRDFEKDFAGSRDPEVARKLNPELQSFEEWLQSNAARIPIQ